MKLTATKEDDFDLCLAQEEESVEGCWCICGGTLAAST
jgi:hypothetical protein